FDAPADANGLKLSKLGYQFVAGVLKHAHAISAVIAPTVNSYKRLVRRQHVGLHLGADPRLLRQQQPHQHAARAARRRPRRMPRRRHVVQPLSRRRTDAGRRPRRHPRKSRPRQAARREHVPAQRGRIERDGRHPPAALAGRGDRRLRGRPVDEGGVRPVDGRDLCQVQA
ncbi:MAG: glutamine synthetase, partial [Thiobacillus sp.]|nr:glutamine synthetase [Thiobacillus sp.]